MKYLRSVLFASLFSLLFISCSKDDVDIPQEPLGTTRYNSLIVESANMTSNVRYGSSTTQGGVQLELRMDIYQPEGDPETNRPLVILAHGGGFFGGDKADMQELANFLARSGYVVASISYRIIDVEPNNSVMLRSVIDAVFDMKAAVRFLRNDANNGNTYGIDSSKIFVGGYSAGAFTALHYAYLSSEAEVATVGGSELVDYVNQNGGLEGSSGTPGVSSGITGVINIAGALKTVSLINAGEPALYSVHGTNDEVVPFLEGESDNSGVTTEGSGLIHPVLDQLGIANQLREISGGDHGAFYECQDCQAELRAFIFSQL